MQNIVLPLLFCTFILCSNCQTLTLSKTDQCKSFEDIRTFVVNQLQSLQHALEDFKELKMTFNAAMNLYGVGYVDVFNDKAYLFHRQKMSWENSRLICQTLNSSLVHSLETEEATFLRNNMMKISDGEDFWIGGQLSGNKWVWARNDTVAGPKDITWTNWAPGEPSGNGKCMHMWNLLNYLWDDAPCAQTKRFVCVRNIL